MLRRTPCTAAALTAVALIASAVAVTSPARAQRRTTERTGIGQNYTPGPADLAPATAAAPTKADAEPYTRWKNHDGSAEQAVVFVRMEMKDEATGQTQVRTGTGLTIRCDGFVLVPPTLVTLRMALDGGSTKGQAHTDTKTLTLTFAAGDHTDAEGKPGVPPAQKVFQPRFFEEYRDFTALKANGAHLRALPMLHPQNIKEGMPVRIVYAVPDPKRPGVAKAMSVSATVGKGFWPNKRKQHFEFAPATPGGELPRVPMGAVVIDPGSGLALGMIAGSNFAPPKDDADGDGDADALLASGETTMPADPAGPYASAYSFATFASVYHTQNAVALLPDPSARDGKGTSREDPAAVDKAFDGMVYIPGGPVELYDWFRVALRGEYRSLYGVDVACTAGFWIDRQEVTRKEYAEFLAATGYAPLPAGWTRRILDGREPLRAPDLPVTGVRPEDAEAYALWRGKRLVTPVEWAKASRLASMVFLEEQQKSLYVANEELLDIDGREREAVRLKLAELRAQGFKVDRNARIQLGIQTELDAERHRVVQDLLDRSGFLVQGTAAGGVESDISIYGVRDVTSNAPEWLLQNLGKQGRDVTQKPLYIPLKPPQFLANGQLNPIAEAIGGSLSAAPGAPWWGGNRPAPGQDIRRPLRDGNVRPFANWERQGYTPLNPMSDALWGGLSRLIGMDPDYDLKFFSVTGNGFRCAR